MRIEDSAENTDSAFDARWERFVLAHPGTMHAHRAAWRGVIREVFGHETHYLTARDHDGLVRGVLPLVRVRTALFGDYMVSVPYLNYGGPVADDDGVVARLLDQAASLAERLGVAHMEIRECRPRPGWPARTDKVAMELELPPTHDALLRQVGSKLRAQIKRPLREGARPRSGGVELLNLFYEVFARNMRDLGTPVYSRHFFSSVLRAFPEGARLFIVRIGTRAVAAALTLRFRERVEIPWASSLREFNRYGVNMLLYSEVLRHAIETGAGMFDFGRSTRDAGTYRFKAQWGARPRPLYWHYWLRAGDRPPQLTPSNPKYRLAIRMWQRLPVPLANLIGPHLVRGLP